MADEQQVRVTQPCNIAALPSVNLQEGNFSPGSYDFGDHTPVHGKWFAMSQPIAISCSESVKISQMSRFGPERVDTPRRPMAALGQSHRTFARRLWRRSPGSIAKLRHGNETWSHMTVFGLNAAVLMRHRPVCRCCGGPRPPRHTKVSRKCDMGTQPRLT